MRTKNGEEISRTTIHDESDIALNKADMNRSDVVFDDIKNNKYFLRDQKALGMNFTKAKDINSQSTAETKGKPVKGKDDTYDPYATLYSL